MVAGAFPVRCTVEPRDSGGLEQHSILIIIPLTSVLTPSQMYLCVNAHACLQIFLL